MSTELEEFCDALCNELQREGTAATFADAVRSSSSDTEDSGHLFCEFGTWWSQLLKEHTKGFWSKRKRRDFQRLNPVRILSACSGLLPEASCLKAGRPGPADRCVFL